MRWVDDLQIGDYVERCGEREQRIGRVLRLLRGVGADPGWAVIQWIGTGRRQQSESVIRRKRILPQTSTVSSTGYLRKK